MNIRLTILLSIVTESRYVLKNFTNRQEDSLSLPVSKLTFFEKAYQILIFKNQILLQWLYAKTGHFS